MMMLVGADDYGAYFRIVFAGSPIDFFIALKESLSLHGSDRLSAWLVKL